MAGKKKASRCKSGFEYSAGKKKGHCAPASAVVAAVSAKTSRRAKCASKATEGWRGKGKGARCRDSKLGVWTWMTYCGRNCKAK